MTNMTDSSCFAKYDYIFGFGSIMNTGTHASWLSENMEPLKGTKSWLLQSFGYKRSWNFRSSTGFTALGLKKDRKEASKINGVLFRVPKSMMEGFDKREVGYDRVNIPLDQMIINPSDTFGQIETDERIWMYVPQHFQKADENHPLLQSYVDTVMHGCLEWGGREMAEEFVLSTDGWSLFFLNDTPSSRRPWLFRKQYDIIDGILRQHGEKTFYSERKHPEQFASAFLIQFMRGTWSLPRRNPNFTGRDTQLHQMHSKLTSSTSIQTPSKLRVAGMAGVGKTQLCCEYCYRYYPSFYGLVIWLHAENVEVLAAGYRQLLLDTTGKDVVTQDQKDTEEVLMEVKARLFRSKVPWLLIFDNLEDYSLLEKFVPNGGMPGCHVLFTTRCLQDDTSFETMDQFNNDQLTLLLKCFNPTESLDLLCRSAGSHNIEGKSDMEAAQKLAEHLGHLPLALAMAAAYMHRCDVTCKEYIFRYTNDTGSKTVQKCYLLGDGGSVVASSLSLSLEAIQKENPLARETLHLLSWLGPDKITKALIRSLLGAKQKDECQKQHGDVKEKNTGNNFIAAEDNKITDELYKRFIKKLQKPQTVISVMAIGSAILPLSFLFSPNIFKNDSRKPIVLMGMWAILSTSVAAMILCDSSNTNQLDNITPPKIMKNSSNNLKKDSSLLSLSQSSNFIAKYSGDLFEQTDDIWKICKSFSILLVKGGEGSMHRLLAQVLRCTQQESTESSNISNLEICVSSLVHLWDFQPKRTDSWQNAANLLEHVKSVVHHIIEILTSKSTHCNSTFLKCRQQLLFHTAMLSKEAGIFSAMVLNRFKESQIYLEHALDILLYINDEEIIAFADQMRAECFHELGRVFRYQGSWDKSEKSLLSALKLRNLDIDCENTDDILESKYRVADTLLELGVLEVKKHNLECAESFLQQALELLRSLDGPSDPISSFGRNISFCYEDIQAACASTLHQLAAVKVAQKPPSLDKAESLLKEALSLTCQIGSRAATIKQLARVTLRQGLLDKAEGYLAQALDLYVELYKGESMQHINVSAVKFQQGALAFQRGNLDKAWEDFSECLRIRRHVYAYACFDSSTEKLTNSTVHRNGAQMKPLYPSHFDVSSVLHELGCVAFSQERIAKADSILKAERDILERLQEEVGQISSQSQRLFQAQTTNLTWLRKCAKKLGNDELGHKYNIEKANLRQRTANIEKSRQKLDKTQPKQILDKTLQLEVINCRFAARQYALYLLQKKREREKRTDAFHSEEENNREVKLRFEVVGSLLQLDRIINSSAESDIKIASTRFQRKISDGLKKSSLISCSLLLDACDELR